MRHLKELLRNIQTSAAPIFTTYDLWRVRVVHVRQCKLNELLSRARYFHERLQRNYCCTCLVKKIDPSSLSREETPGKFAYPRTKCVASYCRWPFLYGYKLSFTSAHFLSEYRIKHDRDICSQWHLSVDNIYYIEHYKELFISILKGNKLCK